MNPLLVFAQQQGAAPSAGLGMTGLVFQIVAIIAIFYFLMIRPQQKERRKLEETILALKKGDEVVTAGGLVGEVVHVPIHQSAEGKEGTPAMGDRVTIRSGDSRVLVERGRIARVIPKGS